MTDVIKDKLQLAQQYKKDGLIDDYVCILQELVAEGSSAGYYLLCTHYIETNNIGEARRICAQGAQLGNSRAMIYLGDTFDKNTSPDNCHALMCYATALKMNPKDSGPISCIKMLSSNVKQAFDVPGTDDEFAEWSKSFPRAKVTIDLLP